MSINLDMNADERRQAVAHDLGMIASQLNTYRDQQLADLLQVVLSVAIDTPVDMDEVVLRLIAQTNELRHSIDHLQEGLAKRDEPSVEAVLAVKSA